MTTVSGIEKPQSDVQLRLRRIEGQVRGIIGMLEDGKSCEDVVTQIMAARAGMDRVAVEVLKCYVTDAMSGEPSAEARESVLRAVSLVARL
ncbi:MAG: hypothetical protein OJF49_000965 [Ktedonobacterales bacterium]|jgi:DNA-binding FrmR family transcriptional regulator|nr:MAG: hypothetical protein OJF49_000965 [Ktedonobacterales bacterium]